MTKEEILENYSTSSNQYGWCLSPDQARRALDEWAEEVAIDYAYWLFERAFSKLMERPDREGRKLFSTYKEQKDKQ